MTKEDIEDCQGQHTAMGYSGTALCMSRRVEVVLCQLCIRHTWLTLGFLTKRGDPLVCAFCDEALTVELALVSCCRYSGDQRRYHLSASLSEVLGYDETRIKQLFKFLRRCNLIECSVFWLFMNQPTDKSVCLGGRVSLQFTQFIFIVTFYLFR